MRGAFCNGSKLVYEGRLGFSRVLLGIMTVSESVAFYIKMDVACVCACV